MYRAWGYSVETPEIREEALATSADEDTGSPVVRGSHVAGTLGPTELSRGRSLCRPRASRRILDCGVRALGVTPAASFEAVQRPPMSVHRGGTGLCGSDDVYSPSRSFHNRQDRPRRTACQPPEPYRGFSFCGRLSLKIPIHISHE